MGSHFVNQIAPVNKYAPRTADEMAAIASMSSSSNGAGPSTVPSTQGADEFFTFTVGKLDAGMAILIGDRASQIEFPSLLLPSECTTGSVVRISVSRNQAEEIRKRREFTALQDDILRMYGSESPKAPNLSLRAVTQTSIVLEWAKLSLATAKLLSLDIFRNNERLAAIPNPMQNTSTKLSGLQVDSPYSFHLVMRTTAGTFLSNIIRTKTHDMNDTSGISVCFGHIEGSHDEPTEGGEADEHVDGPLEKRAKQLLEGMGAKWSDKIQIDTTHFVCSTAKSSAPLPPAAETNGAIAAMGDVRGAMYSKAVQLSIPVVQPHWIFACAEQKKMVPISYFYLDGDPPNGSKVRAMLGGQPVPMSRSNSQAQPPSANGGSSSIPPTPSRRDTGGQIEYGFPMSQRASATGVPGTSDFTRGEGREAEPHPTEPSVEGPITTTVALPSGRETGEEGDYMAMGTEADPVIDPAGVVDTSLVDYGAQPDMAGYGADFIDESGQIEASTRPAGGAATTGERLEDISLGGDDATTEVDLS